MTPIKSSKETNCGNPTTSECVVWQGGDIACLNIENNTKLSVTINQLATEICNLMGTLNLSDLDLKCVFDFCLSCPEPEKTLKVVLQLIINKVCSIDEIIKNIQSSSSSEEFNVRMAACFQYVTENGELVVELPHEEYTKRIGILVCQLNTQVSSFQNSIDSLNDTLDNHNVRITSLENQPENSVNSSCLFSGTKPITDAFQLLDQSFCQTRNALGTVTDINQAISKKCDGLNTEFASTPGWILSPNNLAQTINNMWIVLCKRSGEIKSIQDNCCQVDCDDVKVGFVVAFEDGLEVVRIRFTNGSGTNIPNGFLDLGSVLTVSDEHNNSVSVYITIENNGEQVVNLLGLEPEDKLTFSLEAKLGNGSMICQKCVSKVVDATASCDFCVITNVGTTDGVIIYTVNSAI